MSVGASFGARHETHRRVRERRRKRTWEIL